MKYTDKQRLQKIYENAIKLHQYIKDKQIKKEDYALTYDMCSKNDYTGCKVRMLVSQEVWHPLAVIIYKETGDKEITRSEAVSNLKPFKEE